MVKNLYNECMALEELLEESVNALGPDARDILAQIRLVCSSCCHSNKSVSQGVSQDMLWYTLQALH